VEKTQENIMQQSTELHFANFLSPILQGTYEQIARYVGQCLELPTTLHTSQSLVEFAGGQADVGFLCGLLYVRLKQWKDCPVELLAAPVLLPARYANRPIYFSDVVVRRDSPYTSFEHLQGRTWAYNERASHSGCNLVCYSLLERRKPPHYFGQTLKSGSHLTSLQMILDGEVDATSIDSHILDVVLQRNPELATQLRIIDMLGPSAIPPIVVAKRLAPALKDRLRAALTSMHRNPVEAKNLHEGLIRHLTLVTDERYDDIRHMLATVQTVTFPFN
jgi:phosphonate transport system substrate-binding protein